MDNYIMDLLHSLNTIDVIEFEYKDMSTLCD